MTVLILHGISGFAGKHWQQWLHDELVKARYKVIMPTLPNAEHPTNEEWRTAIKKLISPIKPRDLIIVGHSMGVPAALELVQDFKERLSGFVSVSGFYKDYGAELNSYFMKECRINISKVKAKIKSSYVIYGDNDPYVPQDKLQELADGLGVDPFILKDGGHMNTDAGYTKLPLALQLISGIKKTL